MDTFTVKAFGMLAEKLNQQEVSLPYRSNTEELKESLFQLYPQLKEYNFSLAVDKKIVNEALQLNGREEIALLPPFSGG